MKYGCIGERLPHSFSREIHAHLASSEYALCELTADELAAFFGTRDFLGINVTVPYKQTVMPYLDEIDETARRIGAVNTVVNRAGRLYGYNTDFDGMRAMLFRAGIDLSGKKVIILGTGGTASTARALCVSMGARETVMVSRTAKMDAVDYETAYRLHAEAEVIINTTPVGMFPHIGETPVELTRFSKLSAVVDAVYNPLRTALLQEAERLGIRAVGGLYMLVAQAVRASTLWTGVNYDDATVERIYRSVLSDKENIVLTGMPSCGKSTVGAILAETTGRKLIDTDAYIVKKHGKEIASLFEAYGEAHFRRLEREAIAEIAGMSGCVIATGGGVVLDERNIRALQKNGRIYFLDRPVVQLQPTKDRPIASSTDAMKRLYDARYGIYQSTCDEQICVHGTAEVVAEEIKRRHG